MSSVRRSPLQFSVYGVEFEVDGDCHPALDGIADEFAHFRVSQARAPLRIELQEQAPDYESLPQLDAAFVTPRNVVYQHEGIRFVDYGGRALAVFDERRRCCRVRSLEPDLLYEIAYLFLLSYIGGALDRRGMHRLHALALSWKGRAILVMLPMGGGKSTLGSALLEREGILILSDDSPFIDRVGRVYAFPLHLGLLEGRQHAVPPEHRRMIHRMEFGVKHLVRFSYFADRVAACAEPGLLLDGSRTLAREGRLEAAPFPAAMCALTRHMIIGVGLFHGLEFILTHSPWELVGRVGIGWSRFRNAAVLARRSRCYRFVMGRDVERNAAMLLDLAARELG